MGNNMKKLKLTSLAIDPMLQAYILSLRSHCKTGIFWQNSSAYSFKLMVEKLIY